MAGAEIDDWWSWERKWQRTITGQSGFEWNFAKKVIQRVPGLDPNNVTPQQSFIGNDGRERRMDFAIEVDDVKIAIEVEGWDKTREDRGKNKQEHDEFNRRIQSLESQGWRVLTVTNAQFMKDPGDYANYIRQLILQGAKTSRNDPAKANDEAREPDVLVEAGEENPLQHENGPVRPIYALVVIVVVAVVGLIIWAVNRGGNEIVIVIDELEEKNKQEELQSAAPDDEIEQKEQPSPQTPTPQPSPQTPTPQPSPQTPTPQPSPQTPPSSNTEVPEGTYLTKSRVDIRTYEDSEGDVDCGDLQADDKPVWLTDPDYDPYNLDGWLSQRGDAWACGIPTYYTSDFDWDFEKWEDGDGDVDCGDITGEKPIYLTNPENDPYDLDGWGNSVGDGVACQP